MLSCLTELQATCVSPLPGVNVPCWLVGSLANRAVSWNPQRRCTGSATETLISWATPGVYVVPPALIFTLPRPPFNGVPV